MNFTPEHLSAYLDGELSAEDMAAMEAALAENEALQQELEALIATDDAARAVMALELEEPAPEAMIAAIEAAPEAGQVANSPTPPRRGWAVAAAMVAALFIGATGGALLVYEAPPEQVASLGWLEDIADYHGVYAAQGRHLVEVPAAEADHIETWLTATLGTDVIIPDLTDQALTFEGARLLVAAGRPVAQLIYTDADGIVVALCQIQTDTPQAQIDRVALNSFDLVSWGEAEANFVIVTDEGRADLDEIVLAAADQV